MILSSTLMGDMAWKGGFMSASSISVMPTLQMSAWRNREREFLTHLGIIMIIQSIIIGYIS